MKVPLHHKTLFSCTLPGRVAIKKNSTQRRYSFKRQRTITMPSNRYLKWAQEVMPFMVRARITCAIHDKISEPLEARYKFYFKNRQAESDVSNCVEAPQDLLTKAGVIVDDKIIRRVIAEKFFGSEPRVEIELLPYEQVTLNNKSVTSICRK